MGPAFRERRTFLGVATGRGRDEHETPRGSVEDEGEGGVRPTTVPTGTLVGSKIYNNKPWALDWVGGLHRPGCGAVVFLSDDNGATWYCCGGVEKSESARNTYDGRSFRTFFLTSVFDKDDTNCVKEDKKVGLDLRLFQGYDVKAFSIKAFDVRGDGTELRMLTAEQFLSRTNGYRVTGCLPVVESSLELTKPLLKFSSPADQLPGVVKEYREAFSRLPLDQQADCAFVPFVTSSRKSRQTPSAPVGKRKQLVACPAPPLPAASPSPLPTVRGGHDIAQYSSEDTEYDDKSLYGRNAPRDSAQEGATALTERNEEEEDGGSCGPRDDDGDDEYMDVGDENMQDQNMLGDDDVGVTSEHGPGDIPTGSVGAVVGRPLSSPAIWHSQGGSQGGHDSQEHGRSKSRKRTRETSPFASAHKRQARTDAVNEARGALVASQEARPPRKSSQGGGSGGRGGGRGGARKGKQIVRAEELRDSGDEGEGVGPRMPDDGDEPLQHAAPIDKTRCFFLEYDERGFAKQKVLPVLVDVMNIKRIPRGNILFNHRSLSANIVRGIVNAIESSITTEPGAWDRPDLVLAPVDRNDIVGGQGRRITPTEFFERDSSKFDWYVVCGQYTVEAMKTLVKKGSPTVDVYGLRSYSKVRVIYFGDEQTRGYFNVSAFVNTHKNRAMMLSFEDAVRDMRQWWIDNHRIEAPKGTVSDKDAVAVTHQKKWQNFLRASMGKACDKAFVKQALENEYSKDWRNKLRGYMNLATSTEAVWPLVEKFFEMFNEGKLPVGDGKIPLDMPAEWEKERDKLHVNKVKTVPRRLGGVEEARQGSGLGPTATMYKEAPFHFKVFVYTSIDKLDLLRAEVKRVVSSTRHIVWDKLKKQTTLLPVCMPLKEVLAAPADIVAEAQKMTCKAVILDISPANFYTTWTSQEFDALHSIMTKCCGINWVLFIFAPQKVQSDVLRFLFQWEDIELILGTWKRVDRPSNDITRYGNIATASRDMMAIVLQAEGGDLRKVTVAPRLVNNLTNVHVVEDKFRKCLGKHGGIEGDESVVYSIWEREPDKLRSLCGSFVGEAEGSIPVAAPSVASMVAPSETAALQDNGRCGGNEEDDIEIPGEASTLAPGDAIPPGYCADPNTIYFLEGKHTHTGEDQWGHDIIWHEGVLQPCIQDGEWKMAVKYTSGWKTFRRMSKDIWLKTTELTILHRVRVENPGQSEAAINAKAEKLFHVLRDNRQLEYNNKFYALRSSPSRGSINWKVDQTTRTLEGSCSHDFMPSAEPASVAAQAGHRGDDGTTVVGPQEVDMTSML
ncbi:hypothetical protein CBR_g16870 [Chara braunii]|uniref:Uncharacterized protein n=1 Tax=Chara braunii TaxID=69332 RepID=A0A388KTZ8_CHABU|nr:hypothetical protein CBR_g16870 [Chara braunii]|eukprot:GBG73527.1 hypothetical protein CBR_g16870 [Chara braunii]